MAYYDEILQPLRWYTDSGLLAFTKRPYDGVVDRVQLICDKDLLMPFILTRTASAASLSSIKLVNKRTSVETDITNYFDGLIDIRYDSTLDYIRYFANTNFGSSLSYGTYNLVITDGTNTWYSEYFKIGALTNTIQFEFWNSKDIGSIIYQNDFKQRFRINAFVSDSGKYSNYREDIKNKNEDTYRVFQRKDKIWEINFFANSYLYDAVQLMEMHDNIWFYDRDSTSAEIEITDITAEKIDKTDYLSIKVEFKVSDNKVIVKTIDSNISVSEYVFESGIYRGKDKLYRGKKKLIR